MMDKHDRRGFFGRLMGGMAALLGSKVPEPQIPSLAHIESIAEPLMPDLGTVAPGWTRTVGTCYPTQWKWMGQGDDPLLGTELMINYRSAGKVVNLDEQPRPSYPPELFDWT
jgi:hypothetical protein